MDDFDTWLQKRIQAERAFMTGFRSGLNKGKTTKDEREDNTMTKKDKATEVTPEEGVKEKAEAVNYNYQAIITESLLKTGREGMVDFVNYLEQIGFFKAPCSGGNHLCKEGGLAEHSCNVLWAAEKLAVCLIGGKNITDDFRNSVIIAAVLHDLGKVGDFGKPMYIENILKSGKQSDAKPFKRNTDLTNVPHAIRSIKIATLFIDLTEDEEWAILCHDGLYDFMKYQIPGKETPLSMIIHWADMWASHVVEATDNSKEESEE